MKVWGHALLPQLSPRGVRYLAKGQRGTLWNHGCQDLLAYFPENLVKIVPHFLSCEQSEWAWRPFLYLHSVNIRARYCYTVYPCHFQGSLCYHLLSPLPQSSRRYSCSLFTGWWADGQAEGQRHSATFQVSHLLPTGLASRYKFIPFSAIAAHSGLYLFGNTFPADSI